VRRREPEHRDTRREPERQENHNDFVIRCALPDEHDEVAHVWLEGWHSTGLTHLMNPSWAVLRQRIPREIENGWSLFVIAEAGEIAAFAAFRRGDNFLDQLFVDPGRQGAGMGRALLAHARLYLPRELWLRCASANSRAWEWYEREGFVFEKEAAHETSGMKLRYYRWRRT
jgi:GNAT superfamily N-acetyltransferase